ncbi:MAG TPA: hypothetical protein VF105_10630 [Gemmatimonadaceae bacterium]
MQDLEIVFENRPGALAEMGEALGKADVNVEGGGVWSCDDGKTSIAHFLFEDGDAARKALESVGIRVVSEREVVTVRLHQGEPGQLGRLARRMADGGVNIQAQYSDHFNRLILVVDKLVKGRAIAQAWMRERE